MEPPAHLILSFENQLQMWRIAKTYYCRIKIHHYLIRTCLHCKSAISENWPRYLMLYSRLTNDYLTLRKCTPWYALLRQRLRHENSSCKNIWKIPTLNKCQLLWIMKTNFESIFVLTNCQMLNSNISASSYLMIYLVVRLQYLLKNRVLSRITDKKD